MDSFRVRSGIVGASTAGLLGSRVTQRREDVLRVSFAGLADVANV
jgi:hypothetical protein